MAAFYAASYPRFVSASRSLPKPGLDPRTPWHIQQGNAGSRRYRSRSTMADYLFFDETFDGLDPVMQLR